MVAAVATWCTGAWSEDTAARDSAAGGELEAVFAGSAADDDASEEGNVRLRFNNGGAGAEASGAGRAAGVGAGRGKAVAADNVCK